MDIRHIVCPVDFSAVSDESVEYALTLATRLGARVDIIHVYQLPMYALPDGALLSGPDVALRLSDELQKQLDARVERWQEHGVPLTAHLIEGLPFSEICKFAEENQADLIVMGSHGRTGLQHLLLGSVAERVVRTATVPVLTVRRPTPED
ncbi:MAG: universal stress protein [Polyangiales bacterium]